MKSKKVSVILLVGLFLLNIFTGCTKNVPSSDQKSDSSMITDESTQSKENSEKIEEGKEEKQSEESNEIPHIEDAVFIETPMDLGGREIKFLTAFPNRWRKNPDGTTPNEVLEVVDALAEIEKDYNCKIIVEEIKGRNLVDQALAARAAGETLGDILEMDITGSYMETLYSEGIVMNLDSINSIIKLDQNPWLPQTEFANMFGKQFGVHFHAKSSGDTLRGVLVYNKTLAEKFGLPDIYELVKNKEWTFEKFKELCEIIHSKSGGEVYPIGYNHEGIFLPLFVFANNGTYVDNTPNGYVFDPLKENTLEAINFVVDLIKAGYVYGPDRSNGDQLFMDGKYVFYFGNYSAQAKYRANMTDEYRLIPVPMGPKATEYCAVTYNDSIFHIFNNINKPEEVAAVLVAIANRCSKKNIVEHEMMTVLSDMESAEVFKMLFSNIKCDLSRVVSSVRSKIKEANESVLKLSATPAEVYGSIKAEVQALLDEVVYKGE